MSKIKVPALMIAAAVVVGFAFGTLLKLWKLRRRL